MLDGHRSFPNVKIKHFLQIDVVTLVETKRISDNVGHLQPGVDENDFHNLNNLIK